MKVIDHLREEFDTRSGGRGYASLTLLRLAGTLFLAFLAILAAIIGIRLVVDP